MSRRLLLTLSSVAFVEVLLFNVLTPLIPGFVDALGLSETQAGLVSAAYGVGIAVFALPSAFVTEYLGAKRTVLIGLGLFLVATPVFGLAKTFELLALTRFLQGTAGALCWTAGLAWMLAASQRERRGEVLGIALAATAAGALCGPAIGGLAGRVGRVPLFFALSGVVLAVMASAATLLEVRTGLHGEVNVRRALRAPRLGLGLWLLIVPGFVLGTVALLGPLQLDDAGWSASAVGATFVVAGACGVMVRPMVGRIADRRTWVMPVRILLAMTVPLAILIPWLENPWPLAVSLVLGTLAAGSMWVPMIMNVTALLEDFGVSHVLALAIVNLAAAVGMVAGSSMSGIVVEHVGYASAYGVLGALCAAGVWLLPPVYHPGEGAHAGSARAPTH